MPDKEFTPEQMSAAIEDARRWQAKRDNLLDTFSPHRERNLALQKWGPSIEAMVQKELTNVHGKEKSLRTRPVSPPAQEKDGPEMDME